MSANTFTVSAGLDSALVKELSSHLSPTAGWTSPIYLNVHPCCGNGSPNFATTIPLDICSTLGRLSASRGCNPYASYLKDCYWVSDTFRSPKSGDITDFQNYVHTCARASAVGLRVLDSRMLQSGLYRCSFGCALGRLHEVKSTVKRQTDIQTMTRLPKRKEDQCKFRFTAYWSPQFHRWFFPRDQVGCSYHNGLLHQYENPSQVPTSVRKLDDASFNLVMSQLDTDTPVQSILRLQYARTGILLDPKQIMALRVYAQRLVLGADTSPAERLYKSLTTDPDMYHCILTARKESASSKVTVYSEQYSVAGRKKPSAKARRKVLCDDGSPDEIAERLFQSLQIEEGKILLCAAWVHNDAWAYFNAYPHAIALDTTRKTNLERRPLFVGTCCTSRKKLVPFFNAFLPSECSWVFGWILKEAFPQMFPAETLNKVRVVLTDHDDKCFLQVDDSIRSGIMPNALHRSCAWHKINRNWERDIIRHRSTNAGQNIADTKFINDMKEWFWTFPRNIETMEEELYQRQAVAAFIQRHEGLVSDRVWSETNEYFKTYFQRDLNRITKYHFLDSAGADVSTSSWAEAEFSSNKRNKGGPNQGQTIDRSAQALQKCHSTRILIIRKECMNDLHRQQSSSLNHSQTICRDMGEEETNTAAEQKAYRSEALAPLRVDLVSTKAHLLEKEWYQMCNYYFCEVPSGESGLDATRWFLVRRYNKSAVDVDGVNHDFHRTRLVVATVAGQNMLLNCGCQTYERSGICCRHIYCITQKDPHPDHCAPHCFKMYEAYYGRPLGSEFSKICDHWPMGVPHDGGLEDVLCHSQYLDGKLEWFLEPTVTVIPVVGDDSLRSLSLHTPLVLDAPSALAQLKMPPCHTPSPPKEEAKNTCSVTCKKGKGHKGL